MQIAFVVYSSDFLIIQYILIGVVISLVHVTVRLYNTNTLNVFDGFILHSMIAVTVVPVTDILSSTLIVMVNFVLVYSPILIFLTMGLILHKETMRKLIVVLLAYCKIKKLK